MDRRLFLAAAAAALSAPGLGACHGTTAAQDQPAGTFGASGDAAFDAWLASFYPKAVAAGLSGEVVQRELTGVVPDPRCVANDRRQPEVSRPASDYIKSAVSADRITGGARRRGELTFLPGLEARFGVASEVLVSIWALETAFGAIQGDMDVIRSCATLAADGRRRELFEANLVAALKIIASGEATRAQLKGSWAGAMGQSQFMPDDYLRTAVDGDGDGKRDIWGSSADALASAANLLARAGWKKGQSWQREVTLPPGFDYSLAEGPRRTPPTWIGSGVVAADGYGWSEADGGAEAQLILPSGAAGPAFLCLPNHFIIRRYNNSTSYALGVGLLADRIAGRAGVVAPWPVEVGLSTADRVGAQNALNKLGFNAGEADGIIGVNTRAALRTWQKSRGLVADGYLTVGLSQQLQAEAAAVL